MKYISIATVSCTIAIICVFYTNFKKDKIISEQRERYFNASGRYFDYLDSSYTLIGSKDIVSIKRVDEKREYYFKLQNSIADSVLKQN